MNFHFTSHIFLNFEIEKQIFGWRTKSKHGIDWYQHDSKALFINIDRIPEPWTKTLPYLQRAPEAETNMNVTEEDALASINASIQNLRSDLGSLQSETLLDCAICNKPMQKTEERIRIKSRILMHKDCFKCTVCKQVFGTEKHYIEHNREYYCEPCHQHAFGLRCAACDIVIIGVMVTALGRHWHVDHLVCCECSKPFQRDGSEANAPLKFIEHEGKAYCLNDYNQKFGPKCGGCFKVIENGAALVSALDKKWHPNCFVCRECQTPFGDDTFYVFEDHPFCKEHFCRKQGLVCTSCDKVIDGTSIDALPGKRYHIECFKCASCQTLLQGEFYNMDERILCKNCAMTA